jgi:alanine racemase
MSSVPHLTIDLGAIAANYKILQKRAAPALTAAVMKANAYGLGAFEISKTLYRHGCQTFFVAYFAEALVVRAAVPDAEIVVFHGLAKNEFHEARAKNIVPVLNSLAAIDAYTLFAKSQNEVLPAYIHIDTGMNREGLPPDELAQLIASPHKLNGLAVKAWMSHLACAEQFDKPMTIEQLGRFQAALEKLPPAPACLCNSSGLFWGPAFTFDLVRPGSALYGINPTPNGTNPMHDVIELKAPILQIRNVDTGMTVGYGATHRIGHKSRIATLVLGYADGYMRTLSNRGQVKIGDFLAPVVGRISMDLITVDVGALPLELVQPGMTATVIGRHRPIDAVALEANTIGYEILTGLGSRFERVYKTAEAS